MKLFPHQVDALEWLEDSYKKGRRKNILALDMGLGKSIIAAKTITGAHKILVICPASLKLNWERELKKWSSAKRISVIKKKSEELPADTGVTIVNFDLLGRKEGKGKRKRVIPNYDFSHFDYVIIDEAHAIKNPKAVRSKICAKIIKNISEALLLTGTPMERPIDLYVPLYAIGATEDSHQTFGFKYCDPKKIFLGIREVWSFRGSSNPTELKKLIEPYMLRMLKEDVIDLPEKTINIVGLDLPVGRVEKNYDIGAILKDPRPLGFEGLAELLHEQAIKKLPQAINHIKMRLETEEKIIIVAKHTDVIDTLKEKLKEFNPVVLDGRCNATQKQEAADTFQQDENCRLIVGQIVPIGTGWTLTAAKHVILVEPDWSYSNLMQVIDRAHRIGQKENVTAEILTIANSIDERVLWTTLEKKGFINEIVGL